MSIKPTQFKKLLKAIDFQESVINKYTRFFDEFEYTIWVDFDKETINYGESIEVKSKEICNFKQNENMVVIECVCRLLQQGYNPSSLVLEPRWKLGHGSSGGKADILVKDLENKAYLIIECKTFESEFNSYWNRTLQDGDQLFSYYHQDKNTKYIALYASELDGDSVNFRYNLITLIDNEDYLSSLGSNVKGYADAKSAEEVYEVWRDIYNFEFEERGIFENNQPYDVGQSKFKADELEDVNSAKMHEIDIKFKNILRQHNIGSHENAFDKLVNLFLAKIVDERYNEDNLQFNWRGTAKDDIKSLIDRLQKLYKQGMKDFLNEEVTYVDKQDINNLFRFYKDDSHAVKRSVIEYFDMLKYYTNNDFAFIDVHNENLFKQNSQVLLKIVQLLQNVKLKTETHNQFLGDLFEGFLDNGVKQSEGQYFTPLPIVRFIVSSLPLNTIISDTKKPLKMIDYACGAGHFLNEYANQVSEILDDNQKSHEYYQNTYGIEKEYRLSKVSKVSAFMYSQDEINIIYDDALKHDKVKDDFFDVLIANPPYSVKGFLETLSEDERKRYILYKYLDKKSLSTNKSIETFFVERAEQLLVSDGIAAIILPASFLTNSNIYIAARKVLISYFDIIAIAEFASGTFGQTGTPTITLFLRRKTRKPETSSFVRTRVDSWFSGDYTHDKEYKDSYILDDFCKIFDINLKEFKKNPIKYDNLAERLQFYYLARIQTNPVIIAKSPTSNKELKHYLGYEWDGRGKSYRIKYLGSKDTSVDSDDISMNQEGIDKINTPLFNSKDLEDTSKINTLIKCNYANLDLNVPESLNDYVYIARLEELIKFKSNKFNLEISTTPTFKMKSKYDLIPIKEVAEILSYKQLQASELQDLIVEESEDIKLIPSSKDYDWWSTTSKAKKYAYDDEIIAMGQARYANIKYFKGKFVSANNKLVKTKDETKYKIRFLYHLFSVYSRYFYKRSGQYPAFDNDLFYDFEMPDVPASIQNKIITECNRIDKIIDDSNKKIQTYTELIIDAVNKSNNKTYKVNFKKDLEGDTGKRVLDEDLNTSGNYPVISANVKSIFGFIDDQPKINDFDSDFILFGLDGDWMTNYLPKNKPFYPTDHCGWIKVVNSDRINTKYLRYVLDDLGIKESFSRAKRPTIDRIASLDIKLPDISIQNKVVAQIEPYEKKIKDCLLEIATIPNKKKEILDKYIL